MKPIHGYLDRPPGLITAGAPMPVLAVIPHHTGVPWLERRSNEVPLLK